MESLKELVLRDRNTLLLTTVLLYIFLVVVEFVVMDRESRVYTCEHPLFELDLNNI